ncbi:MAG: single-stranded DNA-binding protein [Firmicutes bacterium]|nr:single-stranded DNA-binding protein [Bacillota bacterium]
MNKSFLVGNLTRDPEVTTTGTGITVCKFGIAVNRNFVNAAGEREADFFNIVAWRGLGDNCGKYLTKGSKVAISGSIRTRTYEKEGQKHYVTEIEADDVEFLTRTGMGERTENTGQFPGAGEPPVRRPASAPAAALKPIDDDGLPF